MSLVWPSLAMQGEVGGQGDKISDNAIHKICRTSLLDYTQVWRLVGPTRTSPLQSWDSLQL